MSGFGGRSRRKLARDFQDVPELLELFLQRFPRRSKIAGTPRAVGPVRHLDREPIEAEIARFKRSLAGSSAPFVAAFMTAPSPGIIATTMENAHYASHEDYVMAVAREIRTEYLVIHAAGLVLQVDAPDLAMERTMAFQDLSDADFVKVCELHVHAINTATEGIPPQAWRLHCCWSNWEGPHIHDIALERILPVLYQARAGALSIEFANPRHQHEYEAIRRNPLPPHMLLLPGVIDSTTNFVEHPEVVARRIGEAVAAVGDRERVVASVDCGFGTFTGREWVLPDIVWQKLKALRAGADIASARLWGRPT